MDTKGLIILYVLFVGASSLQHVESELSQLPKLFHLDDYERCLDQPDGVFCLGQFEVYNEGDDNPMYDLIQKYSQDPNLYNRSYVHRGYCLTSRCPGADTNLSARFERCMDKWARYRYGLRARLHTLHYCKGHDKLSTSPDLEDTPNRVYAYVLLTILALNIIGTLYDINVEKNEKTEKYGLLRLWSIRKNWNSLTASVPDQGREVRLDALNGIKGIMALTPMYLHSNILIGTLYQRNPRFMEKFLLSPSGPMIGALTTFTQAHLVISEFLTSYSLLNIKGLSWKHLIMFVLRRLARMLPVYLMAVGFAATWWTSAGSGPHWYLVENESATCREKFWVMAGFLQNLVEPEKICLVQTWFLAVDMQIHIAVLVTTWLLIKCRRWALTIISALFVVTLAVTAHIAFAHEYVPFYVYTTPQIFLSGLNTDKSFVYFFMTPANCIMAAVVAMWVAFYHKGLKERGDKLEGGMAVFAGYVSFIAVFAWAYSFYHLKMMIKDPWWVTAMVPIERLVYCIIMGALFILMINIDTKLFAFFRWERFRVISRMSLSISMVHWCVNGIIIGNRYLLNDSSVLNLILDMLSTFTISCVVAVPLTVMVEAPMRQILDKII